MRLKYVVYEYFYRLLFKYTHRTLDILEDQTELF